RELIRNQDTIVAAVGEKALSGRYPSLAHGIIRRNLHDYSRQESKLNVGEENGHEAV
ncbi:MAG: hypothetical protein JNK03_04580, partial [Nitrospira sp.]|nr:hypothetical protein [Nitrospira sp.]